MHIHVPTFRRSDVPTFRRSDVPTFRRSDVPTFRRSDVPTTFARGAVLFFFAAAVAAGCQADGVPTVSQAKRTGLLIVDPAAVDLGTVRQGGQAKTTIRVTNPTSEPVTIAEVDSSCFCLELEFPTMTIAPGQMLTVPVKLDLSKEAHFTGGLRIEVKGVTAEGAVAFRVRVPVEVAQRDGQQAAGGQ